MAQNYGRFAMMADTKDESGDRDATRGGVPPPPGTAAPSERDAAADSETRIGGAVPPLPGAPPPAPAAGEAQAPKTTAAGTAAADEARTVVGGEDLEATVVEVRSPFSLMHVKPPGHTLPITLTAGRYLLGRSRSCDIQLFSPTAHRKHARMELRGDVWLLEPIENSVVLANGDLVRGQVVLSHKMRLQLGDDELMFFDERRAGVQAAPSASPAARRWRGLAAAGIAAAVVAAALLWWRVWR